MVQWPMLRRIVAEESSKAIWNGIQARVLFHFPASAICWGTYETVKSLLLSPSADELTWRKRASQEGPS